MRVAVALVAVVSAAAFIALAAPSRPGGVPPAAHPKAAAPIPPPTPAVVDVNTLVREAQRVQRADALAWARFRFRREIRTERLDAAGAVVEGGLLEFEIMPLNVGGFDERLLRIDGREPTAEEITHYREEASFSKHYGTLTVVDHAEGEESGYSLSTLLRLSAYQYAGIDPIDGLPAHRLDFAPDPVPHGTGVAARVTQAMAGSLWLTVDGAHLVRARAATVRPVTLYLGLGKVYSLEVRVESAPAGPMAPDVYLPKSLTINTDLRVLFTNQHRRRTFTYGEFALVAPPPEKPDATTSAAPSQPEPAGVSSGGGSR
jgi:hypothetical protein